MSIMYPEIEALRYVIRELLTNIEKLTKENQRLNDHIAQISCCCAGCQKHNASINNEENDLDFT